MPTPTVAAFHIVGLSYISLYVQRFADAVDFYTDVFGPPGAAATNGRHYGWRMGTTWLTVFDATTGAAAHGDPRNVEFAIQVATKDEVDRLYSALVAAGATPACPPMDTEMYEPMRFGYVDDPFGARIDVYCPLALMPRTDP